MLSLVSGVESAGDHRCYYCGAPCGDARTVKEHVKPELSVLGAVITMFDGRNKLSNEVMAELYKYFPDKIFRSAVPRNVRLAEAPSYGKSIIDYDPGSRGAMSYLDAGRELAERGATEKGRA